MAGSVRRKSSAASAVWSAAARADWFVVGRSAALIAAFAFSTKVTNVPSVPITLSRSVAILSIWPLVAEKNFR